MTFVADHEQVLLYGGLYYKESSKGKIGPKLYDVDDTPPILFNDTWVWDGDNWRKSEILNNPQDRMRASIAYDVANKQAVLLGGFLSDDCTWVWDGTIWTQMRPLHPPPARYSFAMAYDITHCQVVIFGGKDDNYRQLSDTWVWDGKNWTEK